MLVYILNKFCTVILYLESFGASMMYFQSKKGKDQESIQSSTTPDPVYRWESDNFTIRHHKREPKLLQNDYKTGSSVK